MEHRALDIAHYFLKLSKEKSTPITLPQLLKLVYLAHGWNLVLNEQPLFVDSIVVKPYGPIIDSVYDAFNKYGIDIIDCEIKDPLFKWGTKSLYTPFTPEEKEVMDTVFDEYAKYDSLTLSRLIHDDDTPWASAFKKGKRYISNDDIKLYFEKFVEKYAGV